MVSTICASFITISTPRERPTTSAPKMTPLVDSTKVSAILLGPKPPTRPTTIIMIKNRPASWLMYQPNLRVPTSSPAMVSTNSTPQAFWRPVA